MSDTSRRDFLKQTAAGAAALGVTSSASARGANDRIVMGLIGAGGRGTGVMGSFLKNSNVQLAYICDPDQRRLDRAMKSLAGNKPTKAVHDFREALDDRSVDAVLVATPDHWHAPASILACEAKKHVYVEKPCSHNIREGRLLVQAARRNDRVVQHGTQCRSTGMMIEAVGMLKDGIIGDVFVSKAWNIQKRRSIGHQQPSNPPAGLDYDLWVGPSKMVPYQFNRVDGGWHWWFVFGTGDMGNDGVHDVDYARWGLGVETHPNTIMAAGGKYFFDDDQEFPDTQQVSFEYAGDGKPGSRRMLIYEQRLWSGNHPFNVDSGVEFYGTNGQMFLSRRGKVEVRDSRKRRVELKLKREGQNTENHIANFLDSIKNNRKPNADIEIGHLSASLCHLGNIGARLGRSLEFDPKTERFKNDDEANQLVSREYRTDHWAVPREA